MATRAELLRELTEVLGRTADEARGWPTDRLAGAVRALWQLLYPGPATHDDDGRDADDALPGSEP